MDSQHNAWGNLWTSDQIFKFDPGANRFTTFELPVHGTEIRHISLLERGGTLNVIVPIYRSSQMGVMTVRSAADVTALKAQASKGTGTSNTAKIACRLHARPSRMAARFRSALTRKSRPRSSGVGFDRHTLS